MNVIDAIGWMLLHFLWQGALIGLVYAASRTCARGPQARYALGMCAIALFVAAPLLTLHFLWPDSSAADATAQQLPDRHLLSPDYPLSQGIWPRLDGILPWLVGAWVAGVCLLAMRTLWQWNRLAQARRLALRVHEWDERIRALALRLGVHRPIAMLVTAAVRAPTLFGLFKPVILLPASLLLRLPAAQLEMILAHELCHVRRRDFLVNLVQVVLETLFFYHPAVHWVSARIRADRELCCDQAVLRALDGSPRSYAEALAQLAQEASRLAPAASGGVLIERIEILLDGKRTTRAPAVWVPLVLGSLVLLFALAARLALVPATAPTYPATLRTIRGDVRGETRPMLPVVSTMPPTTIRGASHPSEPIRPTIAAPVAQALRPSPRTSHAKQKTVPESRVANVSRREIETFLPSAAALRRGSNTTVVIRDPKALDGAPVERGTATSTGNSRDASAIRLAPVAPPAKIPSVPQAPMPDAVKTIEAPPTAMAAAAPEDRVAIDAAPEQAIPIPRVTHYVAPRYPGGSEARASGGQVDLQFTIDADGEARDITVLAGAEHPQLADAAVTALRQWRFAPGSAATGHLYRQAIDFDPPSAGSSCRIPIGSHICRSDLAGDATGAAVTALH